MATLSLDQSRNDDPLEGWSLPAWTYHDQEFFELEKERVFASSWQVVCHESDIPNTGDWHGLDYIGESVIVVRGKDGQVRAFTNVCRHRGSRIVDGSSGCAKKLVCPYHAWVYELDGKLTGVPDSPSYPGLDKSRHGLAPVSMEIWRGFIFVRLKDEGPSVANMMAPYEAMVAPYRFEELKALGRVTMRPRDVNWKNIGDNYSDGLHIPVAHPGLTRLFGKSYGVEASTHVDRMWGDMEERPSDNWSERFYQRLLPPVPHLPEANQRHWLYFKLWPNVAFDIYPDQVDFMQWLPISPTTSLIREISYVLDDDRREMRAARYLNWRINRLVNAEDTALITRVQEGMSSRSFSMGPLSDKEVCLRHFCARMRDIIPEARLEQQPERGWSYAR
ncbi:2Fe-2S ferredoxin [Erythrobacter sp. SG61-1L]|uniref:aromatic ring-hydroxylating oxygenase subunit alpha n=1 Tax=Erythrobacter sp. SG61-1L TaxID=1603897 RepID=UPI0006C9221C|nr:aromatic ring-hydroxylating dioxygenase subunit alpha [Erythrobacter sp. SG61-1L]KPL68244.1 2Fe-2S ferredoxin [Erythrobacter sp. SG61-1L]